MGRLRRDKGAKSTPTAPLASSSSKTEPKLKAALTSKSQKKSLKEQVKQLGGNEDDYDLVKDFGDQDSVAGPSFEDVCPAPFLYVTVLRDCVSASLRCQKMSPSFSKVSKSIRIIRSMKS